MCDISYHKYIYGHRRDYYSNHYDELYEHAEPYEVITQFENNRIKNRGGKYHKCKVINERASHKID